MKNIFNSIKVSAPKRNLFDLSHERKMSFNMGDLIPFYVQEVVPGDKFRVNTELMIRLSPMVAPMMHRVNVFAHFFFVPNRIIWNEWEDFITGGQFGAEGVNHPYALYKESRKEYFYKGTLADYLGLPTVKPAEFIYTARKFNILPFRAYQQIYNDYYLDHNIQELIEISKNGSEDTRVETLTLRKRAWEKDYFTSALLSTQLGTDSVGIPVDIRYSNVSKIIGVDGNSYTGPVASDAGDIQHQMIDSRIENLDSEAMNVNINELRRASRLQEWLEKSIRGGNRYTEALLSHFGVKSSDSRLQRAEFLGGGKQPIVVSEVLQTSETTENSPQGNMTGHGISVGSNNNFKRSFEEHGFIIGIMSVLPRTAYQQGLNRMFLREDKFDYYWPEFANLGEQEIKKKEIFNDVTHNVADYGDEVFGYQSRYAEYKYKESSVHGDFRDTMDFYHMGRKFESCPELNETFITADPTHRIFAVTDESVHKLWCQLYNSVQAIRPMPYFGIPKL